MVLLGGELDSSSEELPETLIFIAEENSPEGRVLHFVCLLCDELVAVRDGSPEAHVCTAGQAAEIGRK